MAGSKFLAAILMIFLMFLFFDLLFICQFTQQCIFSSQIIVLGQLWCIHVLGIHKWLPTVIIWCTFVLEFLKEKKHHYLEYMKNVLASVNL